MKFGKTRIAWSAGWGTVPVLLSVLWLRSYSWHHTLSFNYGTSAHDVDSSDGELSWMGVKQPTSLPFSWHVSVHSADDEMLRYMTLIGPQLRNGSQVTLRYWHVIIACVVAAGASWAIVPLRYVKRFSLRTLLIATTVVAVVLGLTVKLKSF